MTDFVTANLAAASDEWNKFLSNLAQMKKDLEEGVQTLPGPLGSILSSAFTTITGSLRSIIPSLPTLPDINLQAQLTSLSGLTEGSDKHIALLNDIKTTFGDGITTAGLDLDTLVANARTAVAAGKTLSGIIPNLTRPADLLSAAVSGSDEIKQPLKGPTTETAFTFTPLTALTSRIETIAAIIEVNLTTTDEDD